ncbi:MAG: hypothetical protein MUE32_05845 [Bacteroidales bacterium]|jgi:hypothetical protein|nr:hypothetical protein [Bacteroidales bacterium]
MNYKSKIRMSIGWVYPIGIFMSYILLFLEFWIRELIKGGRSDIRHFPFITIILVALMFVILGTVQWFKYRNWIYPVLGLLVGIATAQVSFIFPHHPGTDLLKLTYFISFIIIILFVLVNWNSFYSHERFEINSRRLFRLAAERIFSNEDGFTERIYSGGRTECTRDELLGFVRFMHGHYIIRPFYNDSNVCLSFSMNKSLVVINEGTEVSHVTISYDGSVTVKVSGSDYRDFREKLNFDKLCQSLTDTFIRFLGYYREGLEMRILDELKSAR